MDAFPVDPDGVARVYTTYASVISAIQNEADSGVGCTLYVSANFTTAPTAAERVSIDTAKVSVYQMGVKAEDGTYYSVRGVAALPQTTTTNIFQVNGKVEIIDIAAEVITSVQVQACAAKFQLRPTVGSTTDICATSNITGQPVGATFSITGTLANAMVLTSNTGVYVRQAAPIVVSAGNLAFDTGASNTGNVKFRVRYRPIEPGAFVSPL
jgi:hypothetical protein